MCGSLQEGSAKPEKNPNKLLDHRAKEAKQASTTLFYPKFVFFILTIFTKNVFSLYTHYIFVNNPDNEGDLMSVEARMPLETFLSGCAGKVTVLIGPSGSGKSLLMSCLGQQWARKLVSVQHSQLFFPYFFFKYFSLDFQ